MEFRVDPRKTGDIGGLNHVLRYTLSYYAIARLDVVGVRKSPGGVKRNPRAIVLVFR